ncbi:acyl-CoA dehydrogenase family protein [Amycolatopsis sp. H20-H5]|uniref:acyl-CoA dehydrogenase family protein n=1 Tax=Amycolatopsis sp. H20-H5 TaxID=3046309 RepID=UPI002DB8819D|nr:acyl-CoA dehydrogenase family protein [Amycolatopsis sp. H20-H5]MEC3974828.1 acyl-CoA dehydrogenase family protein [Amycolatopsis sp. H20-H5]
MRFALSAQQQQFSASLGDLLSTLDTAGANRAWGAGDPGPGLKIWRRLAELGVTALVVPETHDGLGAGPVDLVVAFEQLGRHCVPGPWTDTVAVLPSLLDDELLASVATGETLASLTFAPHVPYALDADVADVRIAVDGDRLRTFGPGRCLSSVDASRRLFEVTPGDKLGPALDVGRAGELGTLATAAQLLGAGRWLLETSVAYAGHRRQYGREIGGYQAVKHLLADAATGLELAAPLVFGAAVTLDPRDVSAAKVAAGEAAHRAARTGLQVHGAIGYTAEHPLGLRLTRVRALVAAWGTHRFHRDRILAAR